MNPALDPLLDWYRQNQRDLPWRINPTPYKVWISELMLQQTTVAVVIPYYHLWLKAFPSVEVLAKAELSEVLSIWQGLGYYRRARSLHQGAKIIDQFGWPESMKAWMALPGIGRYTASAILSIAYEKPESLIDGNVERVYARFCADYSSRPQLTTNAWKWAESELRNEAPGEWNQALMELGATTCTVHNPKCSSCPLARQCQAFCNNQVENLPTKPPKTAYKKVGVNLIVPIIFADDVFLIGLRQFNVNEWWQGLYGFPYDSTSDSDPMDTNRIEVCGHVCHTVTNHKLKINIAIHLLSTQTSTLKWVELEEFERIGVPSAHRKAWKLAQPYLLKFQ